MQKIAVVMDSTAVIDKKYYNYKNLRVVQVPMYLGKEEITNLTDEEFYQLLQNKVNQPTTSQPALGDLLKCYKSLQNDGYDCIISIHLSSGISGLVKNIQSITDELKDIKIIPFDSRSASLPMGLMVEQTLTLIEENKNLEEILEHLDLMRQHQNIYLVVDDLNYLVRTGRLSQGKALIGTLLKIKPILKFDEQGDIVVFEKVRTTKKAYQRLEELVIADIKEYKQNNLAYQLGIAHADNKTVALNLASDLSKKAGSNVQVADLGIVIGSHTGGKTIGMGIMVKL